MAAVSPIAVRMRRADRYKCLFSLNLAANYGPACARGKGRLLKEPARPNGPSRLQGGRAAPRRVLRTGHQCDDVRHRAPPTIDDAQPAPQSMHMNAVGDF